MKVLIADKGYDASYIIETAKDVDTESQRVPMEKHHDNTIKNYTMKRNLIERMFSKLKNFLRVATRYDKLAIIFLSFIYIAAIYLRLK